MLVIGFEPFCCISFRLETSFMQQLLKVNASATTFCRLFSTATFWRPKLAWRLFAVFFSGKGRQKVTNLFLSSKRMSKRHQKDAKRSATFFGRQKVPEQKSRQKVVALAFSFRNWFRQNGITIGHAMIKSQFLSGLKRSKRLSLFYLKSFLAGFPVVYRQIFSTISSDWH